MTQPNGQQPARRRPPVVRDDGLPVVVWRAWVLRPDRRSQGGRPLLTGIYGYPWRGPELEAKCTQQDAASGLPALGPERTDRYHRVIPDPACTCGIYARKEQLTDPPRVWRRHPQVSGFVELSGRIIETEDAYRAQRARIVGPLRLTLPGPPAWLEAVAGRPLAPLRVTTDEQRYRVSYRRGSSGVPVHVWHEQVRRGIAARYGVALVTL